MGLLAAVRRWLTPFPEEGHEALRAGGGAVTTRSNSPSRENQFGSSGSRSGDRGGAPSDLAATSLLPHDQRMMRRALDLARQAAAIDEVPIGAVVYETRTGALLGE